MKNILLVICLLSCVFSRGQQPVLQEDLSLKYLVQLPGVRSVRPPVIVLLHGFGSDERDLFELRGMLPANYLVVSVRAPYALPAGGYQWYEGTTVNGKRDGDPKQLSESRKKILKFIDEVTGKYNADKKAVYVIGFSQGAIMSYEVGLTAPGKIKGIAPLSGKIYPSLKPLVKNTPDLKKLRIFVSHGTKDDRITFADGKEAADYLKSIGLSPEFHAYEGMSHTISNNVMRDLLAWLKA